ncbi:MAG TPA: DUF3298 and DUF4163 domain-containing protein [Flavobacteriaceae bacterium]|nr:DUF3298 and DUF4163 domain-containing protein [Flavobacteriaceae bacterium]
MKKYFLLLFTLPLFFSCADVPAENMAFTLKEKTQSDFQNCEEKNCPKISLGYLVVEGNNEVSKKINRALDKRRIEILKVSEDKPLADSFQKALENFISGYRNFKSEYPEFPARYELRISDEVVHQSEKTLVVKTEYYIYTGGAHGYGATNFNTFSLETGKLLQPEALFSNLEAFAKYAEKKFREKYEVPENAPINSTGFFFENDTFSLPNNLAVLENEVVLIYNPYEAAAYANGELELRFPKEKVEQWLKKEHL